MGSPLPFNYLSRSPLPFGCSSRTADSFAFGRGSQLRRFSAKKTRLHHASHVHALCFQLTQQRSLNTAAGLKRKEGRKEGIEGRKEGRKDIVYSACVFVCVCMS